MLRFKGQVIWPALLFLLSGGVLLRTLVPTIYTLDSGEFVIGAQTLGIVHAPGYPLYMLVLHLFLKLPIGDLGGRANLLSALCLALTAPVLYTLLVQLKIDRFRAAIATLLFVWSYWVWLIGLFAEIYAPHVFTLTLVGWALVRLAQTPAWRGALLVGGLFGVAMAMNPITILFAPGVVIVFLAVRMPWRTCSAAALISVGVFVLSLLYFPWRYAQNPILNLAGEYDANGVFQAVDLSSPAGILWHVSGRQFGSLFFEQGWLPTPAQISETVGLFVRTYLGFGVVLGLAGGYRLYQQRRVWFGVWCAFFLPYTYFYTTYGAADKQLMFAPSLLLWAVLIAFGLPDLGRFKLVLVLLPVLMLIVFFPALDLSDETSVPTRTEALLEVLPQNAIVFGNWHDIVPVQYFQMIEKQRADLRVYNLFLFPQEALITYVSRQIQAEAPLVFMSSRIDESASRWSWIFTQYEVERTTLDFDPPLDVYQIHAAR